VKERLFEGLVSELITPFHKDGSIDFPLLGELIDFQLANGVGHFFVNGLGGESHELSFEERVEVLETFVEHCKGKAKLMVCVFVSTVFEGKRLMDMYAGKGADAYCFTAPPLFTYTQEGLYDFTSQLLKYTDLPAYIYNCREMGTQYSPELLERLWKDHSNLRGYKDATRDFIHYVQTLMRIPAKEFEFLAGCDATIAPMMMMGGVGCVSFMGNPFPRETQKICDLAKAGKFEEAMQAQFDLLRLRNILKKSQFNAAYMYASEATGAPYAKHSRMVPDQDYVSDAVKEELHAELRRLGYDA
jgi:dihydrodipicolinate synthase/N-acetylneuraminate lyase